MSSDIESLIKNYHEHYVPEHENDFNVLIHSLGHVYQFATLHNKLEYPIFHIYHAILAKITQDFDIHPNYTYAPYMLYLMTFHKFNMINLFNFYAVPFGCHLLGHHLFEIDNIELPYNEAYEHVIFGYIHSILFWKSKML